MTWRRWVILGVVSLALIIGLVYWRSHAAWSEMQATVDAMQQRLSKLPDSRPVLWGEPVPGNAFPEYDEAGRLIVAACEASQPPTGSVEDMLARWILTPKLESPERDQFLEKVGPALAKLRAGAHRQQGYRVPEWELGFSEKLVIPTMFYVMDVVMAQARVLLERGDDVEAARTLLDGMQFGRDRFEDHKFLSSLVGGANLTRPAEYLLLGAGRPSSVPKGYVGSVLGDFSPEGLAVLAAGLARLDRAPPKLRRAVDAETVLLVRQLERPDGVNGAFVGMPLPTAWKFGFTSRYLVSDAVMRMVFSAESIPESRMEWREAKQVFTGFNAKMGSSFNPLMNLLVPQLESVEYGRRQTIATLRILRMAVADARGSPQTLPDPFGSGPLRTKTVDGKTYYWSVGRNSVDDDAAPGRDIVHVK